MSDEPRAKSVEIDRDIKENIGKLLIVMSASTDPGMKIQITAAVIACLKGTLRVMQERRVPEQVPQLFSQILNAMVDTEWRNEMNPTQQEKLRVALIPLHEKVLEFYRDKGERDIRKDLEIVRDLVELTNCAGNWKHANYDYVNDNTSWAHSSALLADIHPKLWEIAVRHELIVMPKWEPFDLAGGGFTKREEPQKPVYPVQAQEGDEGAVF